MSEYSTRAQRQERFERLFATHYEPLLAYALRRTTPQTAQDVVADTFMVLWRRLDDVPSNPGAWLFGVARRTVADHRRAERRRGALVERAAAEGLPALSVAEGEGGPAILQALERLPGRERELLLLIAWDGLEPGEAAESLGVSRVALRVRLHRARKRLAAELEATDENEPSAGRIIDLRVEEV